MKVPKIRLISFPAWGTIIEVEYRPNFWLRISSKICANILQVYIFVANMSYCSCREIMLPEAYKYMFYSGNKFHNWATVNIAIIIWQISYMNQGRKEVIPSLKYE